MFYRMISRSGVRGGVFRRGGQFLVHWTDRSTCIHEFAGNVTHASDLLVLARVRPSALLPLAPSQIETGKKRNINSSS